MAIADSIQHKTQLRITEIFYSLQGESTLVGLPTVFIRLTGCPLRCAYCDTAYAFSGGRKWTFAEIDTEIQPYQAQYICVTGGEPLAQPGCLDLLTHLCDAGYHVSLETSGALSVEKVDPRVIKVMDLKTPSSLEVKRNDFGNIPYLTSKDQVKFVIGNQTDYEWAKAICEQYALFERCTVLFSPSHQQLEPGALADWIIADRLPVRFQHQLHKALWGEKPGV